MNREGSSYWKITRGVELGVREKGEGKRKRTGRGLQYMYKIMK